MSTDALPDRASTRRAAVAEWPTLALLTACYAVWAAVTVYADALGLWLALPILALTVTLHSSLQHETLHGHPFRNQTLSDATVFLPLGLLVPYERFRDLHLAHHFDPNLTDPYDDPEANYLDPAVWARLSTPMKALYRANNTLLGRMLIGPAIGMLAMYASDWRLIRGGDRRVARGYALHAIGLVPVALWLGYAATIPFWAYFLACYLGLSVLKIRTFLEHRAHERASGRTVIIEDRGPLSLLFLNNNYHAVHHCMPKLAWYELPRAFSARRDEFLKRNSHYFYRSYAEIFRAHFFRAKDPVPHPLYPWASKE